MIGTHTSFDAQVEFPHGIPFIAIVVFAAPGGGYEGATVAANSLCESAFMSDRIVCAAKTTAAIARTSGTMGTANFGRIR